MGKLESWIFCYYCSFQEKDRLDFFFYLGETASHNYFTHFELGQSLGGAKTRNPWEKLPDNPRAELGLSHVIRARLKPQWWDDKRFRALKISVLNHSATGDLSCMLHEVCGLIWVYTVCLDLSVRKLRNITVRWFQSASEIVFSLTSAEIIC